MTVQIVGASLATFCAIGVATGFMSTSRFWEALLWTNVAIMQWIIVLTT